MPEAETRTSVASRRSALASAGPFQRLPPLALDRLALAAERHSCPPGEVIFRQGDPGDRFYLVVEGEVELLRVDPQGRVRTLGTVEAGGYFGELALLSDRPRAATARCARHTELLSVSSRDLKRLIVESGPTLRTFFEGAGAYEPPEEPPSRWQRMRTWISRRSA